MNTFKNRILFVVVLFLCLLFFHSLRVSAATTVSASLSANATWALSGSPYVLTKQIQVPSGVTLTIEPGVVVTHTGDLSSSVNQAGIQLNGGRLVAQGTPSARINIPGFRVGMNAHSTADISNADLYALVVVQSTAILESVSTGSLGESGTSSVVAADLFITGLSMYPTVIASNSRLTMVGGSISNPNTAFPEAIKFSGARATLTGVTISSVTTGMHIYGASTVDGRNIGVRDCPFSGIKFTKDTANPFDNNFLYLHYSEIAGNGYGFEMHDKPNLNVTDNSIHDNSFNVFYSGPNSFLFAKNWWGSPAGPLGSITSAINPIPWLVQEPFPPSVPYRFVPPVTEPPLENPDPVPEPVMPPEESLPDPVPERIPVPEPEPVQPVPTPASPEDFVPLPSLDTEPEQDAVPEIPTPEAGADEQESEPVIESVPENPPVVLPDSVESALQASVIGAAVKVQSVGLPLQTSQERRTPVLIIPGMMATEMSNASGTLWLDVRRTLTDIGDQFMDALQLDRNMKPIDPSVTIGQVISSKVTHDGTFLFDYTTSLVRQLESEGYVQGVDVFLFAYDWRYGVSDDTVRLLRKKIADIRAFSGSSKVDVVAHSTGGLIVKKYAAAYSPDTSIGKAVFVGVPNLGAPKAIKALVQGDDYGVPFLADSETKKLSQNFPVTYDLAPSEAYYGRAGGYFRVIRSGVGAVQELSMSELNDRLISLYGANAQAMDDAMNLHSSSFDSYDLRSAGIDLYSIEGCKTGTLGGLAEIRTPQNLGDLLLGYGNLREVPGDGTVPLVSSSSVPVDQTHRYYALRAMHAQMLSQDGVRQQIASILSGRTLQISSSLMTQDVSRCRLDGRLVSVYSPLSISVTDSQGNHAGLSSDGVRIENTIPNADYQIYGEHKFVYLSTDEGQVYSIKLQGEGKGSFTLTDSSIRNSAVESVQSFVDIPVTKNLKGSLLLGPVDRLILDTEGDGVFEKDLIPEESPETDSSTSTPDFSEVLQSDTQNERLVYRNSLDKKDVSESFDEALVGMPASAIGSNVRFSHAILVMGILSGLIIVMFLAKKYNTK